MSISHSHHWIAIYHKAVAAAWDKPDFKAALLKDTMRTLKEHYQYEPPAHIEVHFIEVEHQNFAAFPEFSASVFDTPQAQRTVLNVPLVPAPPDLKNEISYLYSFVDHSTLFCCCACL